MHMFLVRVSAAFLLATCSIAAHAQAAPARPPVEDFFAAARFDRPVLSPDGKMMAMVTGAPGKRDALAVIELATNKIHTVANFTDADVGRVQWVNNQRLVYTITDRKLAAADVRYAPGLFAANFDGSGTRQLADRKSNVPIKPGNGRAFERLLPASATPLAQGAQNSDAIYVTTREDSRNEIQAIDLQLVDTVTGRAKRVTGPEGTVVGWLLDQKGEPRVAGTAEDDNATIHYRDPASGAWRKLITFNFYSGARDAYMPVAFGPDGTLYVETANGKDKRSVHALDVNTGKLSEQPLIGTTDYDFSGRLVMTDSKLLGFRVTTDAESTMWFDPAMKALQEEIDARLGDTVNLIDVPKRAATPWVLVEAYSDVRPKTVTLYNTATKQFNHVGNISPAIKPEQMGRQQTISYKARDGMDISALLTLPAGDKHGKLPLVVLVHGGPYMRGSTWGWSPTSQFLASRGYAVLEPSFRGGTGFGDKHFRAGFKQWGLAMQNDIADAARWAIAQGTVDPKRICIAGASSGGYATLMGLVNDPDLFKCGVNWVGVTDIDLLFAGSWSIDTDIGERYRKYGMPHLIGDRVADAAQFKATSPLAQAARITQPLLLAYGGADRRVPLAHGEKFYAAVKKHNQNVEWVLYPNEGHGWALAETRIDFWARVEKFLDRNIGKAQ